MIAGQSTLLQRSGLELPSTTEGQVVFGPTPETNPALGLPDPDCRIRASDVFFLGSIVCPQRPECCFAQIFEKPDLKRDHIVRADHQIEGKPDCDYGDQRYHDYWIGDNRWRVVEITLTDMTVMNLCGQEETLTLDGSGRVKGESASALVPKPTQTATPAAALPPNKVTTSQGMLGKTHEVYYDSNCDVVHFKPHDQSKPPSVYRWDQTQEAYVDERDPTNSKTPGQLERLAGIVLKERTGNGWEGTRCGDVPPWAL
jgi:hypothetical protein